MVLNSLKFKSLIVSCQSEEGDPFNTPMGVSLFAKAAEMGGACGIRSEGIDKTKMILSTVNLPVIGLVKTKYPDGTVCITRRFEEVRNLIRIGCGIIAVDGTNRKLESMTGPEFIQEVKHRFDCVVVADISSCEEGVESARAGADYIATSLSGYIRPHQKTSGPFDDPDFDLVRELLMNVSLPILAEGRISSAAQAKKMIELGAWAVVIGTAITRPRLIVQNIVNQIYK